jgi:hypothetical protein
LLHLSSAIILPFAKIVIFPHSSENSILPGDIPISVAETWIRKIDMIIINIINSRNFVLLILFLLIYLSTA